MMSVLRCTRVYPLGGYRAACSTRVLHTTPDRAQTAETRSPDRKTFDPLLGACGAVTETVNALRRKAKERR